MALTPLSCPLNAILDVLKICLLEIIQKNYIFQIVHNLFLFE